MRIKGLAAAVASITLLASASSAQGAYQWSDGLTERSYVTNCFSVIQGFPYQEEGAWTWTGQYLDSSNFPGVGEVFYVHVVAGAVGNSCSGQYVHFELLGTPNPQGLAYPAGIGTTYPVFCYAINWNTNPPSATQEAAYPAGACPQAPQGGGFQGDSWDAQKSPTSADPWPLPQGRGWEIQIPVIANRQMSGGLAHSCPNCNRFMGYMLDGNSSPQLISSQGLFVDASAGGGGTPGGTGGTTGSGAGLTPNPQKPAPSSATTTGQRAAALKKCKKKKSKKARKKCKKKALKLPV